MDAWKSYFESSLPKLRPQLVDVDMWIRKHLATDSAVRMVGHRIDQDVNQSNIVIEYLGEDPKVPDHLRPRLFTLNRELLTEIQTAPYNDFSGKTQVLRGQQIVTKRITYQWIF